MVKKKVDPRVQGLILDGVRKNHRSLFVLVGDHGKDQVENLHKVLSKARVKARPSVLWCYKKELGFSTHRKKRIKEIKRDQARGLYDNERDDPFELFVSSTNIRWTFYKETDKILGQTFGMCVLQDFEALTPNILARTIETVEGGGLVIILMKTVQNLKQLYTMSMDVHARFRTEAHHEVVPRFNERFILSLGDCRGCLVLDDELNVLPINAHAAELLKDLPPEGFNLEELPASHADEPGLVALKASLSDTPHVGSLIEITKTLDQGRAVVSFLDAISERGRVRSTVSLTAGRGRGKSAAIGLCLAGAVSYGYSNIFVTAPSPENLKTVFEFFIAGLKALKYNEHLDFEVLQEHMGENGKVVTRVNIFKEHRQTVQYILPSDHLKLAQAELLAIDEAAAIPLPTVKKLMGMGSSDSTYLVFMSSTINGYEGTGRALSLKLIQQLRQQQGAAAVKAAADHAASAVSGAKSMKGERKVHEERWKVAAAAAASYSSGGSSGGRLLTELSLDTPIRYDMGDPVERWLNNLLCLDVLNPQHSSRIVDAMPAPRDCDLYLVNRDALFSYHALSEALLQRIWALYTSAHYKNSPNDLQMLSDAPAHRLFVLLGPQRERGGSNLPDVLCVVQVAFEGFISQKSIQAEMAKANKASGDMIPWTISQQFNDSEFATLSGARIVRIATHPDVQKMGYGSRAVDLLLQYFQGQLSGEVLPQVGVFGGEGAEPVARSGAASQSYDGEASTSLLTAQHARPRSKLPPLLTPLRDRPSEQLHWLGVSFGLTTQLLNFWSRKGFKVCYLRQTSNELTGEHSCVVLHELELATTAGAVQPRWLEAYMQDYRRRLVSLLSFSFRHLETALAMTLIDPDKQLTAAGGADDASVPLPPSSTSSSALALGRSQLPPLTASELLSYHLSHHDIQRLELYSRNMVDHHMILDMLAPLARFVFLGRLPGFRLSYLQVAILLATGLQQRQVDDLAVELDLPVNQVLAFFNKTIRKISGYLRSLVEADVAAASGSGDAVLARMERRAADMTATRESLKDDHRAAENDFKQQQRAMLMKAKDISRHAISEEDTAQLESAMTKTMNKQQLGTNAGGFAISVAKKLPPLGADEGEEEGPDVEGSHGGENDSARKKKIRHKHKKRPRDSEGAEEGKKQPKTDK